MESISSSRSAEELTRSGMAAINESVFSDIRTTARRYCRALDARRSRKRMDGSATVARNGRALYGTDDISDDVTQDAVLIYAKRITEITRSCAPVARDANGEPSAWHYRRQNGEAMVVSRQTIQYWAVRDAAARHRRDVAPPCAASAVPHSGSMAAVSSEIFDAAWSDGADFPTLKQVIGIAESAGDLGRAGILSGAAQQIHGGPRHSSSKVRRTREAAQREWRELESRIECFRSAVGSPATN